MNAKALFILLTVFAVGCQEKVGRPDATQHSPSAPVAPAPAVEAPLPPTPTKQFVTVVDKATGQARLEELDPPMTEEEEAENAAIQEDAETFRNWNNQLLNQYGKAPTPNYHPTECWCDGDERWCDEGTNKPHDIKHCANGCSGGECD